MGDFMRSITFGSARGKDRRKVERGGRRLLAVVAAVAAVIGMVGLPVVTAPTAAQAAGPMSWELPEGVNRVGQALVRLDADGNSIGTDYAAPGRTFHYAFLLENTTDEAVTVTGFESNFTIRMHPNRQADFPIDHCMEFIEIRDFGERQSFPVVIEPGETVQINDNVAYHYIWGPPSNECQQASYYFGPPLFETASDDEDGTGGDTGTGTDTDTDTDTDDGTDADEGGTESEAPEVGAAPTPPSRVETASPSV